MYLIIFMMLISNISSADDSLCYFLKKGCSVKEYTNKDEKMTYKNNIIFKEEVGDKKEIIKQFDDVRVFRSDNMGNAFYYNYGLRY